MKKILIIVLMAALAWIAKLSYDVWGLSTQQATLLNEMHQIEQRSANLNDQVVAMQRQKETLKQNPTALMQRQIVLKEAQLRLLLARQALASGQYTEYQKDLTEVMLLIQQLPDPKAKELLKQLNKLKTLVVVPTPILSTRALLG